MWQWLSSPQIPYLETSAIQTKVEMQEAKKTSKQKTQSKNTSLSFSVEMSDFLLLLLNFILKYFDLWKVQKIVQRIPVYPSFSFPKC